MAFFCDGDQRLRCSHSAGRAGGGLHSHCCRESMQIVKILDEDAKGRYSDVHPGLTKHMFILAPLKVQFMVASSQ
jgi:hypothetical protein